MSDEIAGTMPAEQKPNVTPPGADPVKTEKTFTQAELEAIVTDRLARAKKTAEADTAAQRKEAEEAALLKNQEYKTLAEQRAADLAAVQPKVALAEELMATLSAQLDARIAAMPEEVRALDPGPDNIVARMKWADKAAELVQKLTVAPQAGLGDRPKNAGANGQPTKEQEEAIKRRFRI